VQSKANHHPNRGEYMRLRDLLSEATVKICLESADKEECFEELVDMLVRAKAISDRTNALTALLDRESRAATGIGNGIAIPHGKHPAIKSIAAAVGISRDGIQFEHADGHPVRLVVLLLANANQPAPHVWALAEICRLVQIPEFYRKAVAAKTPTELLDIIDSEE
jgi:mannitol/fructose-specific phosphotransferase system IIA component (Ntr-type)